MATQAIPPPHPSGDFWAKTREFSEQPADLENGWQILRKRWHILKFASGFEANSQDTSFERPWWMFPKSANSLIILNPNPS
jgi:hypothetical protein